MKTLLSTVVALLLISQTTFAHVKSSRRISGTATITTSDDLVSADNSAADVDANLPACVNGLSITFIVESNNNMLNLNAASGDGFYGDPSYGSVLHAAGGGTTLDADCFGNFWYIH